LIDIETRTAVDLLPDRATATVAGWLAGHSGVEVICRDRSTAYAEAGRLGAPDAVHVADRWHIWKNLTEAVGKTVVQHRALLREPEASGTSGAAAVLEATDLEPDSPAAPRQSGRLSDRVREQHAAVHTLLKQGIGLRLIAGELGLARNTVRRLAHAATAGDLLVGRWTGLPSSRLPTAIVAFNDQCAIGVLAALARAGVAVLDEVSVVGYDDDTLSRLSCFNLTTVSQGAREQARHAVTAAVERLDQDRSEPREVVLTPHLIVQGTTAEPA
jgi:hypothetical protein